ncbi:MAG: hypothetical protein KatS3mg087_0435 [Patescibacteria group bacterium]|nr:MAG: hypothetical protein KatS3mg087_0435 [Patescibacteria group bacterium]
MTANEAKEMAMEVVIPEIVDESTDVISQRTIADMLITAYAQGDYAKSAVIRHLLEEGDEDSLARIFNRVDELRAQLEHLDQASSWLIADMLKEMHDYFKQNSPVLTFEDIVEELYRFVGPDSFLRKSENTIYKYIEVARQFPPGPDRAGLSFRRCLDGIDIGRQAIKMRSSMPLNYGDGVLDREEMMSRVSDIVRRVSDEGGSKSDLTDTILREIGGINYPFVVQEPSHHRPIFALDVEGQSLELFPILGTHSLSHVSKMIKNWLKTQGGKVPVEISFKLKKQDGDESMIYVSGWLATDPSNSFVVVEDVTIIDSSRHDYK